MNYIGIRGHRGAGKMTIAYLLGETINYLIPKLKHDNIYTFDDEFKEVYTKWCEWVKEDEDIITGTDLEKVYFENFGDGPKTIVALILGMDAELLYDDWHKDHTVVNLKDFSYTIYPNEIPVNCLEAEELYQLFNAKKEPAVILKDKYVTLREFIMYFGKEIMQRYFGLNVWVKSLKMSDSRYPSPYNDKNYYKIFADAKFPSEITYIKDNNGIIIKVNRPGHKKKGKDMLLHDDRYDYEVTIGDRLEDTAQAIFDIAYDIINKNNKINVEFIIT